eukprot:snap_masked-scaffold_5-processed-gene-8.52-mRNA-1 protein AED:1.00 eAED:1.00 QI:0/0/0/0/1/1/2/0/103
MEEGTDAKSTLFDQDDTSHSQTVEHCSYSIRPIENFIHIQSNYLLNEAKRILAHQGRSQNILAGMSLTILNRPPCAKSMFSSLFDLPYPKKGAKYFIFNLMYH